MRVRKHHLVVSVIAAAGVVAASAWYLFAKEPVLAACTTGAGINVVIPSQGATISGTATLGAVMTPTSSPQPSSVTFVITSPANHVLGNATLSTSSGTPKWLMQWPSTSKPDGSYQLMAVAHYGANAAADCSSAPVQFYIRNSTTASSANMTLTMTPNGFKAQPGARVNASVSGTYTSASGASVAVTPANGATYNWMTNGGTVAPLNTPATVFTAGKSTGTFMIKVSVTMNGLTKFVEAPVGILAAGNTSPSTKPSTSPAPSTSPSPSPSPSPSSSPVAEAPEQVISAEEKQELESKAGVFRPPAPTNANPKLDAVILKCLKEKLGDEYEAIASGQAQPTTEQRQKSASCFSGPQRIPSRLAPVEPAKVSEVPKEENIVKLNAATNVTMDGKKLIKLSGTATPNQDVFIYIFSDPMVLRAQADSNGKWEYVLENPLEPGDHEMYAVSEKDQGNFVRSSVLPIAIAVAAGSQDGSLVIESKLQPMQLAYIGGALILLILAIVALIRFRSMFMGVRKPAATLARPIIIPGSNKPGGPSQTIITATPEEPANNQPNNGPTPQ